MAGEADRAADIIERHRQDAFNADRWLIVERWLAMLPQDLRLQRPKLILTEGWIAYLRLQLARFPEIIEQCEAAAGDTLDTATSGELLFFRGSLAYWVGDAENSRRLLEESLLHTSGQRDFIDGEKELALALARAMVGDDEAAVQTLDKRILDASSSEVEYLVKLHGALLLIHLLGGNLGPALATARRLRSTAAASGLENHEAWGDYFEGWVHLAACDVDAASRHFDRAANHRYVLDTRAALDAHSGLALSQHFLGQPGAARETVGRLQRLAGELNEPEYVHVAESCAARIAILQGDSLMAERWAKSFSADPDLGSLFMWLETPLITQARSLIASGSTQNLKMAADSLGALRQSCEEWRFQCQVIEIAVLQALVLEKQGSSEYADAALAEAVALARPGGWVRPFIEAGPVMAGMLERLKSNAEDEAFVRRVLAVFEPADAAAATEFPPAAEPSAGQRTETSVLSGRPTLDALTDRELDILELLHERLYNKEIATRLCISTHTVNYHLKNIYSKLGVTSRRQAVQHALESGILKTPG